MTPLQIKMLLHYHCSPGEYPGSSNPAQQEAIQAFMRDGLVMTPMDVDQPVLSERGKAYVRLLCTMPLPVAHWAIPGPWTPTLPQGGD